MRYAFPLPFLPCPLLHTLALVPILSLYLIMVPHLAIAQSVCSGPLTGVWLIQAAAPAQSDCTFIDCAPFCVCESQKSQTPIPKGSAITHPIASGICHDGNTLSGEEAHPGFLSRFSGTVQASGRPGIVDDVVEFTQVTQVTVSGGDSTLTTTTTVSGTGIVVVPGLLFAPIGVVGNWERHDGTVVSGLPCFSGPAEISTCTAGGQFETLIIPIVVPANIPPIANAGPDQTVTLGSLVTLNGSGSFDPDRSPQPLRFSWTQTGGPAVTLIGSTTATPTVTPTVTGSYTFQLVVNDGQDNSTPDSVTITIIAAGSSIHSLSDAQAFLRSPQALNLAQLAQHTYDANPGSKIPPGSGYTFLPPRVDMNGFVADAYQDQNGNIVVAFRGTDILRAVVQNVAANIGFLGVRIGTLQDYMRQGATFIADIHHRFPNAAITLTGHSLGGGVAEILGEASGLTTVAFNAPGVADVINELRPETDPLAVLNTNHITDNSNLLNVILQGDPVHLVPLGAQIGQQVTLQTDAFGSSIFLPLLGPMLETFVLFYNHRIETIVKQMKSQAPVIIYTSSDGTATTAPGQSYTPEQLAQSIVMPVDTTQSIINGMTQTIKTFNTPVKAGEPVVNDPPPAIAYIFQVGAGDPNFASVALPLLEPSQGSYEIDLFQGGTWQFLTFLDPLTVFVFPESGGVDKFRVTGINAPNLAPTDPFLTQLTFVSDGTFTGTITALSPEPDTVPPTTTASATPPPNATGWNNTNVTIMLSAVDNPGGSGVKQLQFSLTGASSGMQTVPGSSAVVAIANEGVTTLTYFATDNAGNQEVSKTLTVRIDKTPPAITVSSNPTTLWPPNGKMVSVTIAGTITDAGSGVNASTATYAVTDEYGSAQPSGKVTLGSNGNYSFTIQLQASRDGNDKDGRKYTITVKAQDNAGTSGSASTVVTVPHDQGN